MGVITQSLSKAAITRIISILGLFSFKVDYLLGGLCIDEILVALMLGVFISSLITVLVSQINWCDFCVDINSMMVLNCGNSEQKLADLKDFKESNLFTGCEKVA